MIDFRIKATFFDRQAVMDALGPANARALGRAGAFIRRRAKSFIRKRKEASRPGQPPSSHIGTLRDLIFFGYDTSQRSIVVGPTPVGSVGVVPPTLEYGGPAPATRNPRRQKRAVGQGGEIRLDGPRSRTSKKNREGRVVTYTRLVTQAQVDRANRLNEELYGPETLGGKRIAARPYMGPALVAELPNLPPLWANSITT